ncbi:MAG TPA: phosphatase PAP2 family protein [Kineosporiaceae bacterium]
MTPPGGVGPAAGLDGSPAVVRPPGRAISVGLAASSVVVIVLTAWAAGRWWAVSHQIDLVRWFNHPPQPVATLLAAGNPLLRPVPLALLVIVLLGWALTAAGRSARWEVGRAAVLAFVFAEALDQVLKHVVHQPRPLTVIPGLDMHGYPKDPLGHAYPSAHTAVAVAVVSAVWPWIGRPQRVVGVVTALLVGLNRIYIGAHWPIDVLGGAAVGLLAGSICWLIAARWPIRDHQGWRRSPPTPTH